MHHEPIFNRDLPEHRERVYRVLGYLSAALHAETSKLDRIRAELDRAPL
ncbi:hypothetical protein [Saccharopolyspora sp. CA-218241]